MSYVTRIRQLSCLVLALGAACGTSPKEPNDGVDAGPDGDGDTGDGDGDSGDGDTGDGDGDSGDGDTGDGDTGDGDTGDGDGDVPPPRGDLIWADEFDIDGTPDDSKWSFERQDPGWVNDELQAYTGDRSENVRVEGGRLIIEARRDFYEDNEYTSGRILSAGKGDFSEARIEVRAKLPDGRGTWPAIWMMPTDGFRYATTCSAETGWTGECDAWPNSGEIDIMEYVGHDPGVVHGSIHCAAYNWPAGTQKTAMTTVSEPSSEFHDYALEKRADRLDFYVDDDKYFTYQDDGSGWETWPFDAPFHVILNLAIGGVWGGVEGVDPDAFPQRMEVEYVRVYELAE
jgi:beta-glucanase (GH16 family)